jgi:RimJ/RimL family protein N-acetyltransferase
MIVVNRCHMAPLFDHDHGTLGPAAALAARDRRARLPFAQIDAATGEFAGTTSFYQVNPALRTLGIGHTWLGQRWWRTGHNTESKLLMLSYAFETLGAVRVVWHTDIRNTRSQVAIERLGAVREGVLRKHRIRWDGSRRDTVQYAMVDDDWPAAKAALAARLAAGAGQRGSATAARPSPDQVFWAGPCGPGDSG